MKNRKAKEEPESDKEIGDESRGWCDAIVGFEDGRGPQPTNGGASRSCKKQIEIPLQNLQKGAQPN